MGNAVVTDCRLNWKPLEQKGQSPGALEGHCMCCLENNAKLFLPSVGFSYDLDSGMWEKKVEMKDDEHRSGACCSVIAGREVFLFGGLNQEVGWMANLVKLDSQNMKYESWNEIANEPCARDKFSMVNVGGNLVVFGGFGPSLDDGFSSAGELMSQGEDEEPNSGDEMNVEEDIEEAEQRSMSSAKFRWFNDMHIFNLQKKQWRTVVTDAAPPPRAAHGMCVSGGFIYVFGGKSLDGRVNDLWRIPVVDILQEDKPELTPCWTMLTAGGILPSARSFHSFHSIPDSDRLIVFGGMDNNNTHLNDVHVYCPDINAWCQPAAGDISPSSRGFLASCVCQDRLIVHGGSADWNGEQPTTVREDMFALDLSDIRKSKMSLPEDNEQKQGQFNEN